MDRRFTLFALLVAVGFVANQIVYSKFFAPPPPPPAQAVIKIPKADGNADQAAADKGDVKADAAPTDKPAAEAELAAEKPADADKAAAADAEAAKAASFVAQQWGTLGSADPASPYRVSVTWNNRGAAIERLSLNSNRYHDLEDRSGFLGHLEPANARDNTAGALVQVVPDGTPAALAGMKPGDVITQIGDHPIASAEGLIEILKDTTPNQSVQITVTRDGAPQKLTAELKRHPLQVIRPELDSKPLEVIEPGQHDPFSFLTTIQQYDDRTLSSDTGELGGVNLRDSTWEVIAATPDIVKFRATLSKLSLQITKTFRLAKVPTDETADPDYPAYGLYLDVAIANVGKEPHKVAYRLDGPTGLPIEGAWYANKVSRTWGGAGMRDVIVHFDGGTTEQIVCATIADPDAKPRTFVNSPLDFIAVDGIYFSSAIIPEKQNPNEVLFAEVRPIRVGALPTEKANYKLTDVSFRLDSTVAELKPSGPPLEHHLQIFAGPKRPTLLAQYGPRSAPLSELIYYGWFGIVARPMLAILHAFYMVVGNYGLSIIMLTVLVRGCMFPLSRKQALNAQKMQELQPEIKRIQEKYKSDPAKKAKEQQQLFRDQNYNPLSGCLPAVVQLPIFVGLYRSLMVDVELRQAPLFGENIRWASNLAAPDMFWNWSNMMPDFITHGTGFFALGPYLNILPLVTIGLFIWQQKMFMPPPADEQAAMQQKMMQYMMIFMGIMFFKVASGLCVYFIASSIWGISERKLLPKAKTGGPGTAGSPVLATSGGTTNGAAKANKRQRGRK